jgi:hypothetical protein
MMTFIRDIVYFVLEAVSAMLVPRVNQYCLTIAWQVVVEPLLGVHPELLLGVTGAKSGHSPSSVATLLNHSRASLAKYMHGLRPMASLQSCAACLAYATNLVLACCRLVRTSEIVAYAKQTVSKNI